MRKVWCKSTPRDFANSANKRKEEKTMLYYKAINDGYDYFNKNSIIKNELLTTKERNSKVFWSFGARFEKR